MKDKYDYYVLWAGVALWFTVIITSVMSIGRTKNHTITDEQAIKIWNQQNDAINSHTRQFAEIYSFDSSFVEIIKRQNRQIDSLQDNVSDLSDEVDSLMGVVKQRESINIHIYR